MKHKVETLEWTTSLTPCLLFYPECRLRLSLRSLETEDQLLPSLGLDAKLLPPAPPQRGGPVGDLGKMAAVAALHLLFLRHCHPPHPKRGRSKCDLNCLVF